MFTLLQFLKLQLFQLRSYNGPEGGGDIPEPLERSPRPPKRPDSLEGVVAEVGHEASTATTEQAQFGEAAERLNPNTVTGDGGEIPVTSGEGVDEGGEQTSAEGEYPINPELREELIDGMDEAERADFESKTPEEQFTYLRLQLSESEAEGIRERMRDLGVDMSEQVFGELSLEDFEALSPEQRLEMYEEWSSDALERIDARERELIAERETATLERQIQIDTERASLNQMRAVARGEGPGSFEGGFFRGEAGQMTPEQLAEFGRTGEQLASYASNCTPATNERFYCGKNTGEAMNGFYRSIGKPELQINDRPRHGYMWSQMLAARPNDYREIQVSASEAPPGAIISYAAGPGGSSAFAQYGHVEIALGNGSYYFGQEAQSPGGSRRPPVEGQYRVFMPIALGNAQGQAFPQDA